MSNSKLLINHMKKFTTFEWLLFIKILENKSEKELEKLEKDKLHLNMLQNSNWYLLILDLSIRISDDKNRKVSLDNLPTIYDYYNFVKLYINSNDVDKGNNFSKDLDYSLHLAMLKMTYEQFKMYAHISNSLGRLIKLYGSIENKVKEVFGLSPNQIAIFYMLNNVKHDIYVPFSFKEMFELLNSWDNSITEENLKKFFTIFSITVEEYRLKLKALGITKTKIKSKRLISHMPILDLTNGYYFIPSKFVLNEALSYKIFEVIDGIQEGSETFKRNFGSTFENYIRELTYTSHVNCFYECHNLIKDEMEQKKAEFFLSEGDTSIVIESKLLHIDEDILLHGSAKQLDRKMDKRIKDALSQIESCFNYLKTKYKYGIIVIHTHMPMIDSLLSELKATLNSENKANIILVSIIDFEVMIHNPYEKIIEYFQKKNDDKSVALFFEQENSHLQKASVDLLKTVKDNLTLSKDLIYE
ncbi:MAG: hypothetical protein U9O24_03155 [Campylobacterota bacterium]|nr:hypothetical protein [Campylobacterota bacterium]